MNFKEIYKQSREGLRSGKGRNILSFLVFLAISAVFWVLLALNDDVQRNYVLPVTIESFPENATVLSGYNPTLNVTIKDKGSSLMQVSWAHSPALKLRFDDFTMVNDTMLLMAPAQLNAAVRNLFGMSATVVTMRPDSLRLTYTTNPGIKVPLIIRSDVRTLPQYAYAGHPICDVDSVEVFSNSSHRFDIHSISTKMVELANLTDTTTVDVALESSPGMRVIPSSVTVRFPVEPLVAKKRQVAINAVNVPAGRKIVTFPSMVEVSYLLPKSMYNKDNLNIKATVDYNMVNNDTKSLSVSLSKMPSYIRSVSVSPQQVEYVIEQAD